MTTVFSETNILFVLLNSAKSDVLKDFMPKGCHQLQLNDETHDRQTYLTNIINHSHKLMADNALQYLDIIFIDNNIHLKSEYVKHLCALLNETQFICCRGYNFCGKMGIYYDVGAPIQFTDLPNHNRPQVDIPSVELSAFRLAKNVPSAFKFYDKWNSNKYLDLELAFYAKEQGQYFSLIESEEFDVVFNAQDTTQDKVHKAAIYNELFVKNCFDIKQFYHPTSNSAAAPEAQFDPSLEIINSHLTEIKNSNRKLEYINSKIGNYDALLYDIQENQKTRRLLHNPFSYLKPKLDDSIIFSLASIPEREGFLYRTIKSIYKQCDQIYVYLNGYDEVPAFLNKPKIKIFRSQDHGDLSANGKVWFLNEENILGYVFLIDDDIIYPKDYVCTMIGTLQKYDHKFAACVHGSIFADQLRWYYQRSAMFPFRRPLVHDAIVNLPGSGTFVFHTDTLNVSYEDFAPFTMVDLIMGIECKNQSVPIVSVARHQDWLEVQKDHSGRDLWSAFKSVITLHTPTALANGPWDFNSTKAYVLPHMEAIFGTLSSETIENYKLDKQFLNSAYKATIPEVWSFAGRMHKATENNYQKFLYSVSNDYLDKSMDCVIYDENINEVKRHKKEFRKINNKLQQLILECELEPKKQCKNLRTLSKIKANIQRITKKLVLMDKMSKRFNDRKHKLADLKAKQSW